MLGVWPSHERPFDEIEVTPHPDHSGYKPGGGSGGDGGGGDGGLRVHLLPWVWSGHGLYQRVRRGFKLWAKGLMLQAGLEYNCQYDLPIVLGPGVLLSNRNLASNLALLRDYGVTHVINATRTLSHYHKRHLVYCRVIIDDTAAVGQAELVAEMKLARRFIKRALDAGGRVLIHCADGNSVSPAIAIMYLMLEVASLLQ